MMDCAQTPSFVRLFEMHEDTSETIKNDKTVAKIQSQMLYSDGDYSDRSARSKEATSCNISVKGHYDAAMRLITHLNRSPPALALNLIVAFCFCFNCFSVLENSQSLAQGNRLRVSLASESAKTVSGLAVLAAVLYVMIFSSTLSCISDVVFICFQCTGNQNCFKVFLIWNAIDILITFVCDVALYYMVQSVTSEGYKVTQTATDTEEEKVTASSWDYAQATLMENFPSDPEVGPEETPTEDTSASSDSNPQKVIAFTETLRLKPSLSYIFLAAVFKGMVLVTFQQNTDHGEVGGSSCPPHEASSSSVSRIAVWKAQYAQHRSRLETIRARALELQSASPDLQLDLQQNPPPITERAHAPDPAKPTLEPHSGGSLSGQEDVSANVGDVTDENADIGASPSMKRGESEGSNLSSKIKNELRHHKEVDAEASKPKRAHLDGIENNVTKS
ncbi:hypothetical protein MRX96_013042 [Rhipicephalus microplus]